MWLLALSMPLLGVQAEIIPQVREYVFWVSWSMPFTCLYMVPRAFIESHSDTLPMLWIWLLLLPLNALGNYVFMFRQFGFRNWAHRVPGCPVGWCRRWVVY
ncbi:MAG: hypothetical protein R3E89_11030 [Thiolinea sp.]